MKNLDLTKIANQVRAAHSTHTPIRFPAMTVREAGILAQLLMQSATESKTVH
ncbi:hypothetical protein [Castellaniella sp. UC4442_H9]